MQILSRGANQTMEWGEKLARHLRLGDIISLFGELGTGKTTFVKGVAQGLKIKKDSVSSSSFVLLRIYQGRLPLYHFDLYRLKDPKELYGLGYEDYLFDRGITVIEWAERMGSLIPDYYLSVKLTHRTKNTRLITFTPYGRRYKTLINKFAKK